MRLFRALLLLPLAFAACKPHPAETVEAGPIVFAGSGFSLEPGPGWIRVNTRQLIKPLTQVVCQPALTTKGATIQVAQLGDRISEKDALAQVSAAFEADELAIKESRTQSDFKADSGAQGKIVRYTRHTAPDPARILNYLTQYIVRTTGGRWISIAAMSDSLEQANDVDAMVRRTLREIPPVTPTPRTN
jgi:hypothetical protein